jgi:enoyl-CoA hydratase/carnithine racemase
VAITGVGRAFSTGGDVEYGWPSSPPSKDRTVRGLVRAGIRVVKRIDGMRKPVIAAVNGAAAGAGAALALACDIRIASQNASIGLTFTRIGLHPDWGAAYFLPRLIGSALAAELVYTGGMINARRAERLGLFNSVVPADELEAAVRGLAGQIAGGPAEVIADAKQTLRRSLAADLDEILEMEAQAQLRAFHPATARKGSGRSWRSGRPDSGGADMGGPVRRRGRGGGRRDHGPRDRPGRRPWPEPGSAWWIGTRELVAGALERIRANLDAGVERGKVDPGAPCGYAGADPRPPTWPPRPRRSTWPSRPSPSARAEAGGLPALEAAAPAGAILATNTSSLSITDSRPDSPGPNGWWASTSSTPSTSCAGGGGPRRQDRRDAVVDAAVAFARWIGKEPIVVKDSPGFASSRLGVALGLEAMRMLEEGVASAEDIDTAMTLGYRHPMGPLRLTDLVGLDVRLDIAEYLHEKLGGERFRRPGSCGRRWPAASWAGRRAWAFSTGTKTVRLAASERVHELRDAEGGTGGSGGDHHHRPTGEAQRVERPGPARAGAGAGRLEHRRRGPRRGAHGRRDRAFVAGADIGEFAQRTPIQQRAAMEGAACSTWWPTSQAHHRLHQRLRPGRRLRAGPGLRPPHRRPIRPARSAGGQPRASSRVAAAPSGCRDSWAWAGPCG